MGWILFTDHELDKIKENGSLFTFCTKLKNTDFTGAHLDNSEFEYADLLEVKFDNT